MLNIAVIQMVSSSSIDKNLERATHLLESAKTGGAKLAVLPENFLVWGQKQKPSVALQKQIIETLGATARELDMWIVAGTFPLNAENILSANVSQEASDRPYAATLIFNNAGEVVGEYLKVHLFDASVADDSKVYRESDEYAPGHLAKTFSTPWQDMGVAVCYDIRFPEIFTKMNQAGAKFVCVPSAFTHATGAAHWEVLLRARAIENQCFIFAANQGGRHYNGRETFGHSMIVSPWGDVLSRLKKGEGLIVESVDLTMVDRVREAMPMSEHRRLV